ncbi:coiled-coil domain-containing protein 172-like isoform X1 [Mytilus edulis]|uniref:coiled-coil domain-containing protein 172-like isoform X1 n=2 Tax=Mytilus edulis TaxID=6550 RepID=UPI0039EF36F1
MTSLDDLFEQIIHTERKAQERRSFLNEIKCNVQKFKEKTQEAEREGVCLHGQLATKVQQMNEDEITCKMLQNKQKTLNEQLDILKHEFEVLRNETVEVLSKKNNDTDMFCSEVEEFAIDYSLISNGQSIREREARQEIANLKEKHNCLRRDSQVYEDKKRVVSELNEDLQGFEEEKTKLERMVQDLNCKLQDEIRRTEDKENLLSCPITTPEFVKLQHQLDTLKNENLEEKCNDLQKEMCRLQQLCWQRQLKERQKQQDVKRQTRRQEQKNSVAVSNRVQLSNFSSDGNNSEQIEDDTNMEIQDLYTEDLTDLNYQKSLFKTRSDH